MLSCDEQSCDTNAVLKSQTDSGSKGSTGGTLCHPTTLGTNQKLSWTLRGKEKGREKATRQELLHLPSTQPNNALHSFPSSAVEGAPVPNPICSRSGLSPSHVLQDSIPAMIPSLSAQTSPPQRGLSRPSWPRTTSCPFNPYWPPPTSSPVFSL